MIGATTVLAATMDLECLAPGLEVGKTYFLPRRQHQTWRQPLLDVMTALANQQHQFMLMFWLPTAHKRIKAFNAMNEALFEQEIQCAINGRRLGSCVKGFESIQQVIGLD
jgi:hypothetical protein